MNHEGHAVALITGDSTTDQRVAVLNRYSERERERERERVVGREGGGGRLFTVTEELIPVS